MSLPPARPEHDDWDDYCWQQERWEDPDDPDDLRDHPALRPGWPGTDEADEEIASLRAFETPALQQALDTIRWIMEER